jgi:hypothetical protein
MKTGNNPKQGRVKIIATRMTVFLGALVLGGHAQLSDLKNFSTEESYASQGTSVTLTQSVGEGDHQTRVSAVCRWSSGFNGAQRCNAESRPAASSRLGHVPDAGDNILVLRLTDSKNFNPFKICNASRTLPLRADDGQHRYLLGEIELSGSPRR